MKYFFKKEKTKIKISIVMILCTLLSISALYLENNYKGKFNNQDSNTILYKSNNKVASDNEIDSETELKPQLYIDELEPIAKSIGYGQLVKNADMNGNPITLRVENNYFAFERGIFAHAKSTLVYDLEDYNDYYKYFVAFIGLNRTAAASSNGVIYHFYTSNDNNTWNEVGEGILKKPGENATYVEIPLNNVRYLKFYIDDNRGNGNDHSAFADAKLVKDLNNNFVLPSVSDYDNEIKTKYNSEAEINDELEHLLLKRELVNNVGQYTINSFYNASEENKETITWLMNNKDVLKYYILGGKPDGGSYYNSLTQLSRLYSKYKNDFILTETTEYGTVYGDLYTRMAIALSLTHAQRVALWMQPSAKENQSDAVNRYQIYKDLHRNGKFRVTDNLDITKWFERYNVEDMRFVMNNLIDDESIIWLNEYIQSKIDAQPNRAGALLTPHPYMAYVWPNYGNNIYYDEENYDYFNDLFAVGDKKLYDYKISRGTLDYKLYKVWMNFRNKFNTGAVCGGISKTGSNIRATHGIPATVIGQPGHAALLYYTQDSQGRGAWGIDNDVSGWTLSEKGERMLLGWGNASYTRGSYQVVYMALAQEALNDYDNFAKSEEMLMFAKTYNDDLNKKEELLRKSIKILPINIDTWYELINLYNNSEKTEDEYYDLSVELAESLKYFPLPMYQLTNLIKPKLTSVKNSYRFTLLQTRILTEAARTPNNTEDNYYVYQPSLTRLEANYLLGKIDKSIATFSFDGNDAGKIVLSSRFDGNGIRWDYSLDGKNTWKEVSFTGDELHKLQLTRGEINSITAENDIYVHIVGVNYDEENLFKIDITKGTLLNTTFANDLENRIVGVNLNTEWRYNEEDSWNYYSKISPDLTGDKTIQIRQAANGTSLASEASPMYTFTLDNQPDTRKYIPVSHLSIAGVSTEAVNNGGSAINSIDGNYNTRWHSAWNGTDTKRYIIIKLDKPVVLSAVEFVPAGGGNGKIYDGTIFGSMDNSTWEELASLNNLTYTNAANTNDQAIGNTKSFEIENPKEVQYVKIVAKRASNGNWFTARAFNLYQDITKNPHPTAGISYSTTEKTNGKVIARIINPSTKITITNNDGSDTYIFSENGEFTFEFVDEYGRSGSAKATVSWIDEEIPSADVEYNLDNDKKLVILLDNISEDVYLIDKNNNKINYIEVEDGKTKTISYLDTTGNITKMVDVDKNGCITKITYINRSNKVTKVKTYETIVENGVVISEEYYDEEGNIVELTQSEKEIIKGLQQSIANPLEYTFEDSGEYVFKLLDKANNIAYKSIKVDYVGDDIIASDITYNITKLTNKSVIATINPFVIDENSEKQEAEVINSDKDYEFSENGEFTFEYKNALDVDNYDIKHHTAKVDWIDKTSPTASIKYKTLENGEVVATLFNESETIIITNNSSSPEHTFTKNGEFTFEFIDLAGNEGSAKAVVNSIVKKAPNVKIVYSTTEKTKNPVTATVLDPENRITIVNNQGKNTYTFENNDSFTFVYMDEDGKTYEIVATVSWITNSEEDNKKTDKDDKKEEDKGNDKDVVETIIYNYNSNKYNTNTNNSDSNKIEEPVEENENKVENNIEKNKEENKQNNDVVSKNDTNNFKKYAIEFIIIGLLISGIIILRTKMRS